MHKNPVVTAGALENRWRTDGKFFSSGAERVVMRAVTYGPFPGGWPEDFDPDFRRMAAAGLNAVRLFEMPDRKLLDAADRHGLRVFGGLTWGQNADFFRCPALFSAARVELVRALRAVADHSALAGVFVGNEIPADLVRWMGPLKVRRAIEGLIELGRETSPDLLFAYANYPSTEYLEPENADFSAFNVYLEEPEAFRKYLKRLHHIAGDRPLVISEFGLDSRRNGLERQAEVLGWASMIAGDEECAGLAIYAWSDRWWNNDAEVLDWDFGLLDRAGGEKPAFAGISENLIQHSKSNIQNSKFSIQPPSFSVIICTRNGRDRIGRCLTAACRMGGCDFEIILVDDGSTDGTADFVEENFPSVRVLRLPPNGLSVARNAGAAAAHGEILAFTDDDCEPDAEWLARLCRVFETGRFSAAGGPNLPPPPQTTAEAVVCAAPGAPSHVLLDDEEAEHLPGCNLAVMKTAFASIGGFDPQFHTAGDDVDFCWRLRAAGFRLGFSPGAFVWHRRRPSISAFLRQQRGYGKAERLLITKHPEKFSKNGGAQWQGFVYGGGPVRVMADSIIYHGPMGTAGYQAVTNRMLPLRGLEKRFDRWYTRLALAIVSVLVPRIRSWDRNGTLFIPGKRMERAEPPHMDPHEYSINGPTREKLLQDLLRDRWKPGGPTDLWDAQKHGARVLLATEHGPHGRKNTLVRVWGDAKIVTRKSGATGASAT